jgi:hypothetical protein
VETLISSNTMRNKFEVCRFQRNLDPDCPIGGRSPRRLSPRWRIINSDHSSS